MTRNVLMLSGTASAINYIKALREAQSIRLHVTDNNIYCPGLYASGIVPMWLPRARDTQAYRAALDRILAEYGIDILIPTSDYDVEGVIEYLNDGWSPEVSLFRPPYEAFRVLAHKGRLMQALAESFAANTPLTIKPDTDSADLPFPVVVKPTAQSGGKGVTIVPQRSKLAEAIERTRRSHGDDFILQEFIPGQTYVVTMLYGLEGQLIAALAQRSHQTFFTWGGGGCAGEIVDEPDLLILGAQIVAMAGGWCGPINLEFRRHAQTGVFYLMEVNCRLNGYSYLTTMNGLDLPRAVIALLAGDPLPPLALPPPAQRRNFVLGFRETVVDEWLDPDA